MAVVLKAHCPCSLLLALTVVVAGWAGERAARPATSVAEMVAAAARGEARIVDLSYAISDTLPAWPGDTRTGLARRHADLRGASRRTT
jgi:hypothetical protein